MQKGGDIQSVYNRLRSGLQVIQDNAPFALSQTLGYITSCPSNLGTGLRASIHVKLKLLSQNKPRFEEIAEKYHV